MQRFPIAFALPVLLALSAFSQDKPNFTGTWKQTGVQDAVRINKIDHRDPHLMVVTHYEDRPRPGSSLHRPVGSLTGGHEYTTNGIEEVEKKPGGLQRWTTVSWQGSSLVFLTVEKDGYHVAVTREAWMISEGGRTLTKNVRVVNMDAVTEKTITFEKQ